MAQFRVEVPISAPVPLVWSRLTDWPSHAQLAPLTTIRVVGSGDRPGSGFVARTGVGLLAFDDPMEIEEFEPPSASEAEVVGAGATAGSRPAARFLIRKTGHLLRGWIVAELWPGVDAPGSARVVVDRAGAGAGAGASAGSGVGAGAEPGAEAGASAGSGVGAGAEPVAGLSAGTRLIWTEEVRIPPEKLTRFADPVVAAVARAGYGAALRKFGRQIEGESRG